MDDKEMKRRAKQLRKLTKGLIKQTKRKLKAKDRELKKAYIIEDEVERANQILRKGMAVEELRREITELEQTLERNNELLKKLG